jgi:hypothetical protein
MNEGIPNPENPAERIALLNQIKQRLEAIGGGRRLTLAQEKISIALERTQIEVIEDISDIHTLIETLSFHTEEETSRPHVRYSAFVAGIGEIDDEVLAMLDSIEREKSITLGDAPITLGTLKRIQEYLDMV